MSMFSAAGQTRPLAIGPDGNLITGTIQPNVSQFGWTSSDLSSVTDIVKWVDVAQLAAASATASAQYSEDVYNETLKNSAEIATLKQEIETDISSAKTDFSTQIGEITTLKTTIQGYKTDIQAYYNYAELKGDWIKQMYDNIETMYEALRVAFPGQNLPLPPNRPTEPADPFNP